MTLDYAKMSAELKRQNEIDADRESYKKLSACEKCIKPDCKDRKWDMFTCTRQERQEEMPIDDLNACYQRPPIGNNIDPRAIRRCSACGLQHVGGIGGHDFSTDPAPIDSHEWKTKLTWTDTLANTPAAMDASRERPPIKSFIKEPGEPAVQISGDPDPEALKKFDEKRTFATGATRDSEAGKNDYEGFLSPRVIEAYGDYMTRHRVQSDGSLRDSDNWKLGQPKSVYIKSAFRHFLDLWKEHCGYASRDGIDEALGGLLFNIMGYWLEYLRERGVE